MRTFSSLVSLVLVSVLSTITASALTLPPPFCNDIDVRKEWRQLTNAQKISYTSAVRCLQTSPPSASAGPQATSRFEEFQLVHLELTHDVHAVGQFLPWHRQYVTLYHKALRDECGYNGPTPYWDWSIDADSSVPMADWPIFDPVTGFGGDGVPGTFTLPPDPDNINPSTVHRWYPQQWKGCVQDGPFANTTLNVGPHIQYEPHCFVRGFNETLRHHVQSASVNKALAKTTYREFCLQMDNFVDGFHPGGHWLIGGELGDTYSSPGDPLFYLHHGNIDRIWWKWQLANPFSRLYQMGGFTTFPGGTIPTTLDFNMEFGSLGPDLKVKDLMNTLFEPSCFIYM